MISMKNLHKVITKEEYFSFLSWKRQAYSLLMQTAKDSGSSLMCAICINGWEAFKTELAKLSLRGSEGLLSLSHTCHHVTWQSGIQTVM